MRLLRSIVTFSEGKVIDTSPPAANKSLIGTEQPINEIISIREIQS